MVFNIVIFLLVLTTITYMVQCKVIDYNYLWRERVYLLCYVMVKEEMNNNWRWFLDLLHHFLPLSDTSL
jgi:hypothetical protein